MSACVKSIIEIAGKDEDGKDRVSAREAAELLREIQKRAREIKARDGGISATDALAQAGEQFKRNAETVALVKKRNAYLGRLRRLQAVNTIRTEFADDYERGLKSLTVGTQGGERASRWSAANAIDTLKKYYESGFMADINRIEGGYGIMRKGLLGREVANVLFALNKEGADLTGMDPRAIALGKVIHKWQEFARTQANKAGAWIGKLDGYIVTQSHDMFRIAKDRTGWMAVMRERADLARMMEETGAESADDLLNSIYNGLSTGVHQRTMPGNGTPSKGLRGAARGLSHDRVIHFKSADDWFEYNEAFGEGSIYDAASNGLRNTARATGLMRVFGPNHEATFGGIADDLLNDLQRTASPKTAEFERAIGHIKSWYLNQIDGTNTIVGNDPATRFLQMVRMVQTMASLGASTLSSVADTAVMAVGAKFNGMSAFDVVANGLGNFVKGAKSKSQDEIDLLSDLGLALETFANAMVSDRYGVDDGVRGMLGRWQRTFFMANMQNRWTDAQRSAIAAGLSSNLARRSGQKFSELTPDLQRTLGAYGIDDGMWDIFRAGALREVEGRKFLTPSSIQSIDDAKLKAYLDGKDQPSSPRDIRELRFEMERKFRGYFVDQNGYMLLTPDAATMGALKLGTRADSAVGQIALTIAQFKSFSVAFSQRVLTREFKQHGMAGVANMIFLTTLAGYAAMTLKDAARGKKLRPASGKTVFAAMTQGGGLGIFGDILTSQLIDPHGQDAFVALLGPTAGDINSLVKIGNRAIEGRDPTAAAVRFAQGNTPFVNIFYTKLALDYLVFWNAQEAVNPGSLARMERELENQTGQQYYLSPSRDRAGAGP